MVMVAASRQARSVADSPLRPPIGQQRPLKAMSTFAARRPNADSLLPAPYPAFDVAVPNGRNEVAQLPVRSQPGLLRSGRKFRIGFFGLVSDIRLNVHVVTRSTL
jgi:hypothetical protein